MNKNYAPPRLSLINLTHEGTCQVGSLRMDSSQTIDSDDDILTRKKGSSSLWDGGE